MPWTFTQEGPLPKTLTLTGWQQPYGRPRAGEVVDIGTSVIRTITRLSGNVEPIVNAFTTKGADWRMHGRWIDRVMGLGAGTSMQMALAWKQFVNDKRIVRASWDNLIAYRIFINEMSMKVEGNVPDRDGFNPASGEIVWEMSADVITDLSQAGAFTIPPVQTPVNMTALMAKEMPKITQPWTNPLGVLSWLLDLLPTLALGLAVLEQAILIPFNLVSQIAGQVTDFASATHTDLLGLSSGAAQVATAVFNMRQGTDSLVEAAAAMQAQYVSSPVLGQQPILSGPNVIALQSAKLESDLACAAMQALLAALIAQVQLYVRGNTKTAYTARNADTWESIALATLGSIDAAWKIRDLNGILFGQQPQPGRQYQIPANA